MPVLREAVERSGLGADVEIIAATCRDRCGFGPAMNVYPGPTFYNALTPEGVERIVAEHLANGCPVRELTKLEMPEPRFSGERSGKQGRIR
jgi:(2Fe-2S) ferredoxin